MIEKIQRPEIKLFVSLTKLTPKYKKVFQK